LNELKKLMAEQKLTQTEVAEELGVNFVTLWRWLTGRRNPNVHSQRLIDEYIRRHRNG